MSTQVIVSNDRYQVTVTGDTTVTVVTAGYAPLSHVGAGGDAHAAVTDSSNGFMTTTQKGFLDDLDAGDFTDANHTHANAATGGQLDHTVALTNVGTNTHAQIDTHISSTTAHDIPRQLEKQALLNAYDRVSDYFTAPTTFTTFPGDIQDVVYGGELFVAVGGNDGTDPGIYTSPDGHLWTKRTPAAPSATDLYAIAFDGTTYVAVGDSGYIITSTDGSTWTARTSGTAQNIRGITWSGTRFHLFALTETTTRSSTDGTTWAADSGTISFTPDDIASDGAGRLIVVDNTGVEYSDDAGATWTSVATETGSAVMYANTLWAKEDGTNFKTSSDGITWTARTLPSFVGDVKDMTHTGNHYVLGTANFSSEAAPIAISNDGITWEGAHISPMSADATGIAFGERCVVIPWFDGTNAHITRSLNF